MKRFAKRIARWTKTNSTRSPRQRGWIGGIESTRRSDFESGDAELPEEVKKLADARAQARLAKDFRKSDELRDKLNALGWEARDTKDGQKITRRAGAK